MEISKSLGTRLDTGMDCILRTGTVCLIALLALLAAAVQASPELPVWRVLEFEQHALWATAKSRVSVDPIEGGNALWQLTASSSVVSNSEEVTLALEAETGRTVTRSRLSRGKNQRLKTYDYTAQYILRERRDPGADSGQDGSDWQVTSSRQLMYPPQMNGLTVTSAFALVLLADRLRRSDSNSADFAVHTDLNFYRVALTRGPTTDVEVNYRIEGAEAVTGIQRAEIIQVQAEPLGKLADKEDFSLLGLSGEISLLFDTDSGTLLQLRGVAPRIGKTEINLQAAVLREPGG